LEGRGIRKERGAFKELEAFGYFYQNYQFPLGLKEGRKALGINI